MTNATILKFGYPATLLKELEHWVIMLRPAQVTLGSLVLAAKSDAAAYGELPPEAFAEQRLAVTSIEAALSAFCRFERINYLMLMMVDRQVHFHVIPRYDGEREWSGIRFADSGWPGPPDLKAARTVDPERLQALKSELQQHFI